MDGASIWIDPTSWKENWTHIACVADGSQMIVYVNGEVAGTQENTTGYNTEADGKPLFLGTAPWGNPCNCKMADFRLWSVARTAKEIKNNYQKQVEPSATGLIKNFNFAEGNGDHTANLAEPEGNQAWCMGAIDTDYSWETVAQIPTNLRTENQTENSFDILWDGTDGNTWSVELSANGQVVDTKTRLTEKKASFSNLDKKDYTVRVKAHSFMETAFSDAFSVNLSTSSAITNIHKNISIVRHNNAIQIDGIQTGKLISIYTDQGILSRQISAEHETTVLSIEGFPHGIYFISIEGYGPTFKIAL